MRFAGSCSQLTFNQDCLVFGPDQKQTGSFQSGLRSSAGPRSVFGSVRSLSRPERPDRGRIQAQSKLKSQFFFGNIFCLPCLFADFEPNRNGASAFGLPLCLTSFQSHLLYPTASHFSVLTFGYPSNGHWLEVRNESLVRRCLWPAGQPGLPRPSLPLLSIVLILSI